MCKLLLFAILVLTTPTLLLAADPEFNAGFEILSGDGESAKGWSVSGAGHSRLDSVVVHAGRYSFRLSRTDSSEGGFVAARFSVPAEYEGTTVTLRGFLRTEDVAASGFGGLWLRLDGESGLVEFDNMRDRGVTGSQDWAAYSITLPLNEAARTFVFGGILVGSGTIWLDDFELLIDGRPYVDAPIREVKLVPADLDSTYDHGSGLDQVDPTPHLVDHLAVAGKVWGFLKYHHPAVAQGDFQWDYELLRLLPPLLEDPTSTARNRILLEWIDRLGEVPACAPCAKLPEDLHLVPDLEWIHDTGDLGAELSQSLVHTYTNRNTEPEHYYVSLGPFVENPVFSKERTYAEMDPPDAGFRLLALYRFWNMIEYYFPYRNVIGEPWDDVLREFIPRFLSAGDRDGYRLALLELFARVNDTHCNLWGGLDIQPPVGDCTGPGQVRFIKSRPVVWIVPSEQPGPLQIGDLIVGIDGKPVGDWIAEWSRFYPASNEPTRLRNIGRKLLRGACGPLDLILERDGKRVEVTTARAEGGAGTFRPFHSRPGDTFQLLADEVAYLSLANVSAADVPSYIRRAQGTRGMIIDIRNYPKEFVVFSLGQHLVAERTEFARFTRPDITNPGTFRWTDPIALEPAEPHYAGKIVILVDEVSQSQAEYSAMAFRSVPDAVVVGSTTAGADGNLSWIHLPGGIKTGISGIGVFYPDKTPTQRVGIVPDIVVPPTIEGIREGRDEVLEKAIEIITGPEVGR